MNYDPLVIERLKRGDNQAIDVKTVWI